MAGPALVPQPHDGHGDQTYECPRRHSPRKPETMPDIPAMRPVAISMIASDVAISAPPTTAEIGVKSSARAAYDGGGEMADEVDATVP